MGYGKLAQEALRDVVRQAVARAAGPGGLPGSHHFYISFKTTDPGCDIDEALIKSYPDEMTIVLEHQFWDLAAEEDHFEVTLKFQSVPKYLKVPWRAVTRFHDPAVNFQLYFEYEPPRGGETKGEPEEAAGNGKNTVISLDSFRKKD